MKKLSNKKVRELALESLRYGNPYVDDSVEYFRGYTPIYLWKDGKSYSLEELNEFYIETAMKDIRCGYNDRMVGFYDKWYRYNHSDEGRAYDFGVREALNTEKCKENVQYIEVMEACL